MLRVPKKGSTEWLSLAKTYSKMADTLAEAANKEADEDAKKAIEEIVAKQRGVAKAFEPVEIGCIHRGRGDAMRFKFEVSRMIMEENKRKFDLRKSYTREQAPELWSDDATTPEGEQDLYNLSREIVLHYVNGLKGVEGIEIKPAGDQTEIDHEKKEEIVDIFDQLGILNDVQGMLLQAQGLSVEEVLS